MSNERIKKEGRIELVFLKVCHLSEITFNNKRIVNQTSTKTRHHHSHCFNNSKYGSSKYEVVSRANET